MNLRNRIPVAAVLVFALATVAGCKMQNSPVPSAATAPPVPAPAPTAAPLPPNVPAVQGPIETAFALRYQDIKIGTGADAEPNKLYKINYTGWRAADGVKFDSSYDHPGQPLKDKDGKQVLGEDGKPVLGDPQPFSFPQGAGRVMPGFDQGFVGMKVGGKRRLFIPWQIAYGTRNIPDRPAAHPGEVAHPGIPPKSDLIFDVELVDVSDMPTQPGRPGMGGPPGGRPMPGAPGHPGATGAAPNATSPATPGQPAAPGKSAPSPAPSAPPTAAAPPAPATPPATTPPPTK